MSVYWENGRWQTRDHDISKQGLITSPSVEYKDPTQNKSAPNLLFSLDSTGWMWKLEIFIEMATSSGSTLFISHQLIIEGVLIERTAADRQDKRNLYILKQSLITYQSVSMSRPA